MKLSKFDAVGVNVKVFLESEGEWVGGIVEEYHPRKGYHVQVFDGQDVWLESLDENVQFENDYETAELELMGSNTYGTNMNYTADELEILHEDNDLVAQDQMNVPDYHSHTQYNQESLRADLVTLPSRGVLLTGSVLGAAGLAVGDESLDGEVFFKVLFVEGGSQPAMFRCKTPIYTSTAIVSSLSNPSWDGARFQFDMIMPEDAKDNSAVYGFKIQGEIIIAVYMSRSNGGNTLLGQTSFQLKDIVETGTVEFFASGFEGRSVTGGHTLTSRTGEISGELDVQLNIAWKSLNPINNLSTSQARLAKNLSSSGTMSRPASAGATKTVGSKSKVGIAAGTKDGTAPSKRPSSAAATNKNGLPPPRKIVSAIQRKQKEDAARIARENLKLQQTLQQHANRNGRPSGTAAAPSVAYGAPAGAASATQSAAPKSYGAPRDANTVAESKSSNRYRDEAKGAKGSGASIKPAEGQSIDTLLKLYTDLKKAVALDEQEDTRLKLKIGKLRVSIKQGEMSAERIRSQATSSGDSQSKGVAGGSKSKLRSSGDGPLRASGGDLYGADAKDVMRSSMNRSNTSATGAPPPIVKQGAHEYVPFFAPMSEAEQQAQGLNDGEYKSLAEEYTVLQAVRRGLLDRTRTAQLACDNAKEKQSSAGERLTMINRRVGYYRDIAGKFAADIDLNVSATAEDKNAPLSGPAEEHDDFVLFDRLRDGKQEYVTENAIYQSGMHVIAQENALEELRAVREFLITKCAEKETNIRTMKEENAAIHQELRRALNRDRQPTAVREQLLKERSSRGLDAGAEERLQVVDASINKVDKELQSFHVRQQSRKNSKEVNMDSSQAATSNSPGAAHAVTSRPATREASRDVSRDVSKSPSKEKFAVMEVPKHAEMVELVDDEFTNYDLSPDNSLYDV